MEVLIRVATGLLITITIPGALIVHLCPNGTLFILLTVHLLTLGSVHSCNYIIFKNAPFLIHTVNLDKMGNVTNFWLDLYTQNHNQLFVSCLLQWYNWYISAEKYLQPLGKCKMVKNIFPFLWDIPAGAVKAIILPEKCIIRLKYDFQAFPICYHYISLTNF